MSLIMYIRVDLFLGSSNHFSYPRLLQELDGGVAEGGHDGSHLPEPLGDVGHQGGALAGAGDLIVERASLSVNVAVLKVR